METTRFIEIAQDLDQAGLVWQPEIGDEVCEKVKPVKVSVLVDPQGLSPSQLRSAYLWLPTVEQLIEQLEARQALLFHAGVEMSETSFCYKTVFSLASGNIESEGLTLRTALGSGLRSLLLGDYSLLQ